MSKRIKEFYDPQTNQYPYPLDTDKHYLVVKKNKGIVFDKNYPYIDKSKSFRFKFKFVRILLRLIVFPLVKIRLGHKVIGKENLKEYKDVIKNGVISVCNHVHMWDYLGILRAIKPIKPYILSWAPNINGENSFAIRMVGGIPIPEDDFHATVAYTKAIKNMLNDGGWLHVYSEGSMWEYYRPIRPFKRGAAYFATKFDKPILPLAYTYREPGWIRKKIFKQKALFTLHIGKPIYANKELPLSEQELDLTRRSHEEVCKLAGIDPEKNIYPPIFDNSKRVDYYTTEYGIGYKGSW